MIVQVNLHCHSSALDRSFAPGVYDLTDAEGGALVTVGLAEQLGRVDAVRLKSNYVGKVRTHYVGEKLHVPADVSELTAHDLITSGHADDVQTRTGGQHDHP
jgi:hypothetical protein